MLSCGALPAQRLSGRLFLRNTCVQVKDAFPPETGCNTTKKADYKSERGIWQHRFYLENLKLNQKPARAARSPGRPLVLSFSVSFHSQVSKKESSQHRLSHVHTPFFIAIGLLPLPPIKTVLLKQQLTSYWAHPLRTFPDLISVDLQGHVTWLSVTFSSS